MKINKVYKNAMVVMVSLVMGAMATGCSDWNDHYDPSTAVIGSSDATLWENISSNSELSEFAQLLQKSGYDQVLNAPVTYTVWAPLNGTFDFDNLMQEDMADLRKEFIQNHIARNNYPASGSIKKSIHMLNKKTMDFVGNGSYTMEDVAVAQPNLPNANGVMHTLSGKLPYRGNIYEAIEVDEYPLDSLSKFFHSYDKKTFIQSQSVPGPVVDGMQTYLDSVFEEDNTLYNRYLAYIAKEDSNYTMILPTNTAWDKAYQEMKSAFNYVPSFVIQDPTPGTTIADRTVTVDPAYTRDSMIHNYIVGGLFYNNNLISNRSLPSQQPGQSYGGDSLVSTIYGKVYKDDASRIFSSGTRIEKSNGSVWVVDDLNMRSWNTWNPMIKIEAEQSGYRAFVTTGATSTIRVPDNEINDTVPGTLSQSGMYSVKSYLQVTPLTETGNANIAFYFPGVLSTTYAIYVVAVPANYTKTFAATPSLPFRFRATLGYVNEKGKTATKAFTGTFANDPSKVDTIYIGDFEFPMAYLGTGENYPYLRLDGRAVSNQVGKTQDNKMRFDCLMLVPKELDTYLKEHPDYKLPSDQISIYSF